MQTFKKEVKRGISFAMAMCLASTTLFQPGLGTVKAAGSLPEEAQVSYYSFDHVDGGAVTDEWGGHNGTAAGAEVVKGKIGNALKFDSADDLVTIANPAVLTGDDNWTIGLWIKRDADSGAGVSVMREQEGNSRISIDLSMPMQGNGKPGLGISTTDGYTLGTNPFPSGEWTHLTVVKSSGGTELFVNGTSAKAINPGAKRAAPLKLIGGENFRGSVDEVKVYNTALTAAQVEELATAPAEDYTLVVDREEHTLLKGKTAQINATLHASAVTDKTLTYTSANPEVASVSDSGLITAIELGDTAITVANAESGLSATVAVHVTVSKYHFTIPEYRMPEERQIVIEDNSVDKYLGQPDMIMDDDGKTLFTVYPNYHGHGATMLKKSEDGGVTWSDRLATPDTWAYSQETPTLYKLDMQDGTTKFMQISGGPGWANYPGYDNFKGWTTSISEDQGTTWSEYEVWYPGTTTIVAMASLVHLKDENGNFIDKWMGVYHNYSYENYKSYLTFDENGKEQWSEPEKYLEEYRDIESSRQMCENLIFRSPDGDQLALLSRSQSHMHPSQICFSDDEGETWTRPRDLPAALMGERHKAVYDPISGRLVITFREIQLDKNNDGVMTSDDWMAGDFIAWIGTYEDLVNGAEGDYRIRLAEDWTNTTKSGDCGYAGLVALPDGTIVTDSYGKWDKTKPNPAYEWAYVIALRFKLGEIDNLLGLVDTTNLQAAIDEADALEQGSHTQGAWSNFQKILSYVKSENARTDLQQLEADQMQERLEAAMNALAGNQEPQIACTCKFTNISLKQRDLEIPVGEGKVTLPLSASSILLGDCLVEGHADAVPVYTFEKAEDQQNIAEIRGNNLIISKVGEVKVKVKATVNGLEQEKVTRFRAVKETIKDVKITSGLTVSAGSEETAREDGKAQNAIDGNANTYWHSEWSGTDDSLKPDIANNTRNEFTIDLGTVYPVRKFQYLPRSGAAVNGRILGYQLYYSTTESGDDFQEIPDGSGTWENSGSLKTAAFPTIHARRIQIRATATKGNTDATDNSFISAAEFYVYQVTGEEPEGCTCTLGEPDFAGQQIVLSKDQDQKQIILSANASLSGGCEVSGHAGAVISYTYEVTEDERGIAACEGNVLTVTGAGEVKVKAIASANGKTSETTAVFTVSKEAHTCACTLDITKFDGYSIEIPASAASAAAKLAAIAELSGNCKVEGHAGTPVSYKYEIIAGEAFGKIAGDILTVTKEGTIRVKVTAAANGKTAEKTTDYTVSKKEITAPLEKPGKPAGLKAAVNKEKSIKLTWKKAEGASGYLVYRYDGSKKKWVQIKDTAATSFTNSKLKVATAYKYKVKAYAKRGNEIKEGDFSSTVTEATKPKKPAIKHVRSGGKVKISWGRKKGSDGYEVYRKIGNGKFIKIKTKNAKASSHTIGKLKKGKKYAFKVCGFKKAGKKKVRSTFSRTIHVRL